MIKEKLVIEGMSCNHCVMALKKELTDAQVQINSIGVGFAEIEVDAEKHTDVVLTEIVAEAGYKLTKIEK